MKHCIIVIWAGVLFLFPALASAAASSHVSLDLTHHWVGFVALAIFVVAYTLVIFEEQLHMRKSKPVLLAAGLIWVLIAFVYSGQSDHHSAEEAIRHNFLEYAEL